MMSWIFGKRKTPAGEWREEETSSNRLRFLSSLVSSHRLLSTSSPSSTELLRENKRQLDRAIRDLDRERTGLQTQEKKLVAEIKKAAKDGQMDAVKVMARSLVRNRRSVTKLHGLKAQLQAVSLRLATLKSTQAMAEAMAGATRAMVAMNRRMNMPALTKVREETSFFFSLSLSDDLFSFLEKMLTLFSSFFSDPKNRPRSCATSSDRTSEWR